MVKVVKKVNNDKYFDKGEYMKKYNNIYTTKHISWWIQ
jgi:hypothetical protein